MSAAPRGPRGPREARTYRLVGPAATSARGRVPVAIEDDADAYAVALGPDEGASAAAIAAALPDPGELPGGALVVVLPSAIGAPSFATRVRAMLGRDKAIPRVDRCTALVARGYVDVGAAATSGVDLAWGYAPATEPSAGS